MHHMQHMSQGRACLQVHVHGLNLDFLACGLALCMTLLLILGTRETSLFNLGTPPPRIAAEPWLRQPVPAMSLPSSMLLHACKLAACHALMPASSLTGIARHAGIVPRLTG